MGNRVIVQSEDWQKVTCHAKTHQGGLKTLHSSSIVQPVDLKELLIYKVLEFLGIGAETHFFYDDIKNFYIATKKMLVMMIKVRSRVSFLPTIKFEKAPLMKSY